MIPALLRADADRLDAVADALLPEISDCDHVAAQLYLNGWGWDEAIEDARRWT